MVASRGGTATRSPSNKGSKSLLPMQFAVLALAGYATLIAPVTKDSCFISMALNNTWE